METTAQTTRAAQRGHARRERALVPIRFALLRLRRRWPQALVVGLGIAVGAAVLALTAVGSASVQDRAVQRALAQLQPSDRAIQTVWSGVPAQSSLSFAQLDALAQAQTTPILNVPPFRVEVFRQATWGGAFVNLGAVDGLSKWLTLRSGRLPRICTPSDCELVQIGGAAVQPKLPFLHVVGRARFIPGAPLQSYFGSGGEKRPPILLANGVTPFVRTPLPDAALIARTYGWVVPLAPRAIHDWQLSTLNDRLDAAQSVLERKSDIFIVSGPTDTIAAIRATSRVAAQRLLILGGDAAVLLLGFAVLASTRLRREHADVRRRLTWSGASRSQMLLVAGTEVVVITAVASIVGWLAGTGAGALFARHLGSPGGLVVEHSIFTARSLWIGLALAAVTGATMLVALRADSIAFGGLRLTAADAAALGALAAVLLALARGKADTSTLSSSGTGVLLLLLPALVLFVLAVAAARLLTPLLRAIEWSARRASPSIRVALLSLARAPGEVALTVVFFVLSVGIAVFAFAYRATLVQGEHQQASFAVPAPYVLSEDLTKLTTIQQALPRGGGTPVLRDSGFVSGTRGRDFTLLALPAHALPDVDGWRSDFSQSSPAQLAKLLQPAGTPRLNAIMHLGTAPTAMFPFTITGDKVGVTAVVADASGDFTSLLLGEHGAGRHAPTVRVPPEARGGRVVAFRLTFPTIASYVAGHRSAETSLGVNDASTGTIHFADWPGAHRFVVNNAADAILRPREPTQGELVPVVVSPALAHAAGPSGIIPLHVENQVISGRIVATTRFFPSVEGDLVVADLPTWLTAANTADPGTATASELWRATAPPPGVPLGVASQREREHELSSDPFARGAVALLLVTAVVGLVLAAVGLLLTVLGDLRDERGALSDLSAQGSTPADLRRHLLVRAGTVGLVGLAAGLAAGAIVAALVVAVVTVSAGAENALPPLLLSFDWPVAAAALGALVVASAAAASASARRLR
ncbi:MAG TPA: FtsX-like permease family protein [Gaiellaceae bacterium]